MNRDYFWKQEFDLPKGIGYPHFGWIHILSLCAVTVTAFLIIHAIVHAGEKKQDLFVRIFPWVMVGMEVFKDLFLVRVGRFSADYLPLHLCSLGVFIFLFYSYSRVEKWQNIWGEIAFACILPGSLSALLYPNWIAVYPVFNFMNLYSYIWHMNLVIYPLALLNMGRIHPSIRKLPVSALFLCIVVPPIYLFDRLTGENYLFINWPPEGTPLKALYDMFGFPGWLAAYAISAVGVIAIWYGITAVIGWLHGKWIQRHD